MFSRIMLSIDAIMAQVRYVTCRSLKTLKSGHFGETIFDNFARRSNEQINGFKIPLPYYEI